MTRFVSTYTDCFERLLSSKVKDGNYCSDMTELGQGIESGQKAADTVCQYVDWLLSTFNPNPPREDMWIRPEVHPCQRNHHDIPEHEKQSDYVDLLNMVQRHSHCSTSYCLRKKSNEAELKCRFHFPFGKTERTPGVSYVAISRVKSLASCVIEPMTYERLTSLKSSADLQYRLEEENRLDQPAQVTSCIFRTQNY